MTMLASDFVVVEMELDNPEGVYMTNEKVNVVVTTLVKTFLRFAAATVTLEGTYEFVKESGRSTNSFCSIMQEFDFAGKKTEVPPGTYKNEVSFALEPRFPSSLVTSIGSVTYKCTAKCGFQVSDKDPIRLAKCERFLSVNKVTQFRNPNLLKPCCDSVYPLTTFFFRCCKKFYVYLEVTKLLYVCGEQIVINAKISNQTSHSFVSSEIALFQMVKTKYGRKMTRGVVKICRGPLPKYCKRVWINDRLQIPSLPPTSQDFAMPIFYKLIMTLVREDGKVTKLKLPIIIENHSAFPDKHSARIPDFQPSYLSKEETAVPFEGDCAANFVPSYRLFVFQPKTTGTPPLLNATAPPMEPLEVS